MRNKILLKGNEATIYGALLAGCDCFFGYPITPASEIAHTAALLFPSLNRVFLQAESEIAAINMVFGATAAGRRAMTASSGLGISLKQEGISYLAASELPAVIIDIMRGGPGLGNIGPEQSDYNQVVKGGGHGNYKCIVLAPNSVQEMCDMTMEAFELADKYLTPVYVLADGVIGQMIESITLPFPQRVPKKRQDWGLLGTKESRRNFFTSIYLEHDDLENLNIKLQNKYAQIEDIEQECEAYYTEDAEIVLIGYGISSRIIRSAVEQLRKQRIKAGMLRPKTLYPLPKQMIQEAADNTRCFLCVEMSNGQFRDDIKLAIECKIPVHLCSRMGGNVPSEKEVVDCAIDILKKLQTGE